MHTNSTIGDFAPPAPRPHQRWDASALSLALGGDGRVSLEGRSRCPCPAHHGTGHNLSLRVTSDGRLLATCFSRTCSREEILAAIDGLLGTKFSCPDQGIAALGPRPAHLTRGKAASIEGNADADASNADASTADADGGHPQVGVAWTATKIEKADPAKVRARLNRIMQGTQAATTGSLVANYLTGTRGITLSAIPRTLRQHSRLYHGPSRSFAPALVAVVSDPAGKPVAIHRTWLNPITLDKAFDMDSRMMLGPCHGGAVHLAGHQDSEKLLVGEGIETVLAAAQLAGVGPDVAVWSTLSTSGLRGLTVLLRFRRVVVAADHDANGAGEEAAEALARRLRRHGVKVDIRLPPTPGTDWNDVLLARRGKGEASAEGGAP